MKNPKLAGLFGILLAAQAMSSTMVDAQAYPTRPITLVVPYVAGGTPDILARMVSEKAAAALGQSLVIDNRGGAGGNIGGQAVARSAADGYTPLMCAFSCSTARSLYPSRPPYDIEQDFVPIIMVGTVPSVMMVPAQLEVRSVKEFIELAKKGGMNYASSGVGSSPHLAGEQLNKVAGIEMTHVPYRGAGQVVTDLLANRIQVYFDNLPAALPHIEKGTLRALLLAQPKRSPAAPDVPTAAEAGMPELSVTPWFGIFAPKGTPAAIVDKLNAALAGAMADPAVAKRMTEAGVNVVGGSREVLGTFIAADVAKWAAIIKERNIVGN